MYRKLLTNSEKKSLQNTGIRIDPGLSFSCFNQGYYSRFFRQGKQLGHGLRGTVFIWYSLVFFQCNSQHMLDGVELGMYAVKKIPVGNYFYFTLIQAIIIVGLWQC